MAEQLVTHARTESAGRGYTAASNGERNSPPPSLLLERWKQREERIRQRWPQKLTYACLVRSFARSLVPSFFPSFLPSTESSTGQKRLVLPITERGKNRIAPSCLLESLSSSSSSCSSSSSPLFLFPQVSTRPFHFLFFPLFPPLIYYSPAAARRAQPPFIGQTER